jgi:formylglycine-generating enzyme required for sulfatase activity
MILTADNSIPLLSRPRLRRLPAIVGAAILAGSPAVSIMAHAEPEAPALPRETVRIPGTTAEFQLIRIPGGTLVTRDPRDPSREVRVEIRPLWVGRTEVTWDEYDVFLLGQEERPAGRSADAVSRPSKPYGAPDRGFGHRGYPAISLSFHAAEEYCRWLSALTGQKYRLPTEWEWEWACRAATEEVPAERLAEYAWFWQETTQPVGKKKPNAWGLHDMMGNAGEWCRDFEGKPVLCGGTYESTAKKVGPSVRMYQTPDWNASDPQNPKSKWWLSDGPFAGFRIVREPAE